MEHTELVYSKNEVQRAGENLIIANIIDDDPEKYRHSMQVLSNWRSSHVNVLKYALDDLHAACDKIDKKSIVASRLKRTPSIINKLKRFEKMKLKNMQDIAGCRAILKSNKNVLKLRRELKRSKEREFRIKDYIENPKDDGYRGIHLIGKYTDKENNIVYPVEIQLRSETQHSWATAVEIVDLFTNQSLKSNIGKDEWLEFFKLVSHEFSLIEQGLYDEILDSLDRTVSLIKKLNVYKKFIGYSRSLKTMEERLEINEETYILLMMDFSDGVVKVLDYPKGSFSEIARNYLTFEERAAKDSNLVVALVSSSSIKNLKEAYPNYFADSEAFVENLKIIESKHKRYRRTWFDWLSRWLSSAGFEGNK